MSPAQHLRFAGRALTRDLRAGELRVLALALVVAVASVTAVGFFTDRIGRAMEHQAADVLAADLVASAGMPLPVSVREQATARGLEIASHTRFPSVVINSRDESQLVAVKAVSEGYPLRGALQLATLEAPETPAPLSTPTRGRVWVDLSLRNILALEPGDTLLLGAREFEVERLIRFEPDRSDNVFEIAPRVMMNEQDLDSARLLVAGSRARYSLLMAGDIAPVDDMRDWLAANLADEVRVQGVREGSPQLERALDRAQRFLGLASVVTVLLAGAAIALAVRHFARRQADGSAVLRTLGASRADVITWLVLRLGLIALLASVVGALVGWGAQAILAQLLSGWFRLELPAAGLWPPVIGLLTALTALAGFGLMPVVRAGRVPVMRVLQQDYSRLDGSAALAAVFGICATFCIVFLQSGDARLSGIVVLGVVAMLAVFGVFGGAIVRLVRRLAGARFRLAVAGLQRRAGSSVVQLAAFAMGIMALLLISIVRVDILAAWEQELPDNAPNVFVINIQPDQVPGFEARLDAQNIDHAGVFPMVRSRLAAVNGDKPLKSDGEEPRRREYNLTWSDALPANNELAAGQWWSPGDPPSFSLEEEWAGEMGLEIGDTLTFNTAGVEVSGPVTSLRKVDWESFEVNFFVVASPGFLEELPATFVTSFFTAENFATATNGWVREFPGIATLDIGAIIERVKSLMDRASMAVEYVFLFTLLAGLCVLLAAVQSSQSERIRESALLRALGASHRQVRESVLAEFSILGAIAGFLAALFATLVAWSLSRWVFELPFHPNAGLWVMGVVGGAAGICAAGYLATRKVLHTPPVVALRHGG